MIQLNARQCRQARGLLKWNAQDLASHTKLGARRIEAYERGLVKLETFEIRELYVAFSEAGLAFTSTKVDFKKKPRETQRDTGAAPTPPAPAAPKADAAPAAPLATPSV